MLKLDKVSGLFYDRDNGSVYADENAETFIGSFNPDLSEASMKLFLLSCKESDPEKLKKLQKKMDIQSVHDLPYIISTPEYCYAYVLYKIRKLSGLNQEEMAYSIGMSKSTYNKIENRILSPSLNNLHMVQYVFGITPIEFSQLYWNVESVIIKFGSFNIPSKNSDYNSDEVIYADNPKFKGQDYTTPVHLYDEKLHPEILSKLIISFQEVLLEGKKRNIIREEQLKQKEEEERKQQKEWEALSLEEQNEILNM